MNVSCHIYAAVLSPYRAYLRLSLHLRRLVAASIGFVTLKNETFIKCPLK